MKILVYSETNAQNITSRMGQSEYSYYFVLNAFLPVLKTIGEVVVVDDPIAEVDQHYEIASKQGQACVFLSFTPPHKTALSLKCPTIPVLAWEFDSIPNESWLGDSRQNWVYVLKRCGCAITHSQSVVEAIRRELGPDFAVISIPAPVWDRYAEHRVSIDLPSISAQTTMIVSSGVLIDTHSPRYVSQRISTQQLIECVQAARERLGTLPSSAGQLPQVREESLWRITRRYVIEWKRLVWPLLREERRQHIGKDEQNELSTEVVVDQTPAPPDWQVVNTPLTLSGVVFTALFNPTDGRKNWPDMLTAFCTAFHKVPEATLLFKLGNRYCNQQIEEMLVYLARLPRFECRVILLNGFLQDDDFQRLISASHYALNASSGEGQCLPLMEFLSSGKPAIAPRHSALADYMSPQVGFVVESSMQVCSWPQDVRTAYRTLQHQVHWESLLRAYQAAYQCVQQAPQQYVQLALNAAERMQAHCSQASARSQLLTFLQGRGAQ